MFNFTKAALLRQLAFSLILLGFLYACETPGSVGGELVDKSDIKVDTLLITDLDTLSLESYTGELNYTPFGKFQDPVFGNIESVALLKPSITVSGVDSITSDHDLKLKISLEEAEVLGDSLSNGLYSIYEVTSKWRSETFKRESSFDYNSSELVGSFSDADFDSNFVVVELSDAWKQEFINYYNTNDDSLYQQEHFGLAIIPQNGNKINYALLGSSSLIITDVTNNDSTLASPRLEDWAFALNRTGELTDENHTNLYGLLDRFYTFNFKNLIDNLPSHNIVKAELIFSEDTLALRESLNANEVRVRNPYLYMQIDDAIDNAYTFQFESPYISSNNYGDYYSLDVTFLINSILFEDLEVGKVYLYSSPYVNPSNSKKGLIRNNYLFNEKSGKETAPKLVISSIITKN